VPLVAEITSNHIRSLLAGHLLDVPSSDQHTVKPWFAGRIQYSPPVKDLSAEGFKLVGGRLEYINHQDVAALVYQHNKHIINLYVWPRTETDKPAGSPFSRDGYNVVNWEKDGMIFWAVSDVEPSILKKFSEAMM
jgi:anti-sigma factor RsiW